jgi:hypothetical protein
MSKTSEQLDVESAQYLGNFPNTYCYSKAIAEHLVHVCQSRVLNCVFAQCVLSDRGSCVRLCVRLVSGELSCRIRSGVARCRSPSCGRRSSARRPTSQVREHVITVMLTVAMYQPHSGRTRIDRSHCDRAQCPGGLTAPTRSVP